VPERAKLGHTLSAIAVFVFITGSPVLYAEQAAPPQTSTQQNIQSVTIPVAPAHPVIPSAGTPRPMAAPAPPAAQQLPPAPAKPSIAPAQPSIPTAVSGAGPKPATLPPAQPGQAKASTAGGGSSFFFDDADVFEVIQTVFGEVLRVNYIIDPSVKGRVNFRTTTPIPKEKILPVIEIIMRLNGIAVVEESGLYRIIPIGNISKEPAPIRFGKEAESVELKGTSLMQIVPLTYISSTEMSAILTPLLTQGGAIHDISKRNILIIADTDSNVRRLLQVIAMFDIDSRKTANQPRIYVYAVQNSKAKNVSEILHHVLLGGAAPTASSSASSSTKTITGTSTTTTTATPSMPAQPPPSPTAPRPGGSAGSGDTLIAPSTKIFADEANNSLVILATPADYSVILSALKQIDTIPRQVMIEAVVASVTISDNLTFGMRWSAYISANSLSLSPLAAHPLAGLISTVGFQNIDKISANSFGYALTDKGGNVKVAIEALASKGKAKILSAPHLLVADNKEAKMQVGSQIPIITTGSPATSVSAAYNTYQYKDIGTILKIKPQINDSGLIALELTQEVSDATVPEGKDISGGVAQYVITKSEVTTTLIAQDGESIIIGGLVKESAKDSFDGIPLISRIPLLGRLFGNTVKDDSRQELLIVLTPRVVRNPGEAKKVTADYYDRFKNIELDIKLDRFKKGSPSKKEDSKPADKKTETKTVDKQAAEQLKEPQKN
jgi:general secretion pathway protein D